LKRVLLRAQKREVLDPQALIQQYQEEIAELKAMLRDKEGAVTPVSTLGKSGTGKGKGEMERRLEELKSLILTGREAGERGTGHEVSSRPLIIGQIRVRADELGEAT
jgi:centromeric protein E